MKTSVEQAEGARWRKRKGFALVVTVVLLTFVVLLVFVLAALTRIETAVVQNSLLTTRAQQNALLGLRKGLAHLQSGAGPDTRVTALAEINPTLWGANRRWTAAWDTSDPGSAPIWLVSGGAPNAAAATTGIQLVGSDTAGGSALDYVDVALEDVRSEVPGLSGGPQTIGRFGYWIGDEGTKARADLLDRFAVAPSAPSTSEGMFRHRMPQRNGLQCVSGFGSAPLNDESWRNVVSFKQAAFTSGAPALNVISERYYDLTVVSSGLLTDARAGGVKRDLTPYFRGDTVPSRTVLDSEVFAPANGGSPPLALSYLRNWQTLGAGSVSATPQFSIPPQPPDFAPATASPGVHPLVVRTELMFATSYRDDTALPNPPTVTHIVPVVTLWNPFNVDLQPASYRVVISFYSPSTLEYFAEDDSPLGSVSLGSAGSLILQTSPIAIGAGQSVFLSASNWSPLEHSPNSNAVSPGWRDPAAFWFHTSSILAPTNRRIKIRRVGGVAGASLELETSAGWMPLHVFNLPLEAAETTAAFGMEPCNPSTPPATTLKSEMSKVGHFRSHAGKPTWARVSYSDLPGGGSSPSEWPQVDNAADAYTGYSWRRQNNGPLLSGQKTNTLIELPIRIDVPWVSLAQFQSAQAPQLGGFQYLFEARPALLPGTWDRYFFSIVPDTLTQSQVDDLTYQLPFARLVPARVNGVNPDVNLLRWSGIAGSSDPVLTSASQLFLLGAFNVNSTSMEAWKAVLGSFRDVPVASFAAPSGAPEPPDNRNPLGRFSVPAALSVDVGTAERNTFEVWNGYRRLTDAQVETLAVAIVQKVQELGPFRSMSEFIEVDRVIQAAIDSVDASVNAGWTAELGGIGAMPPPGILTQWDILAVLSPVMTVRSDTFVIRAYGEAVNPVTTAVEGRAYCEAIVQRIPEFMFPDTDEDLNPADGDVPWQLPVNADNQRLGRRFVITSFRWLTPADI